MYTYLNKTCIDNKKYINYCILICF
ncbi:unnamed protein product [Spirodela intermedia]|uniref:Uncharacterized protein n=2 Tax=Spirodela intermedia TaxID=51605 RepID=A0A7I8IE90_SPIIN|nr:unnamed protein product [Spirodela intermedia]CAA6656106.1 unnamed protein product [Spirodela intermedia]CAA7391551.1 unnamed protein product [Spirodela intermedia]